MDSITIMDGLILTVVSMLTVFAILSAIWGLVELISKIVNHQDTALETVRAPSTNNKTFVSKFRTSNTLTPNRKHRQVAELMSLVLASEDEANKKFEIVESKRVK